MNLHNFFPGSLVAERPTYRRSLVTKPGIFNDSVFADSGLWRILEDVAGFAEESEFPVVRSRVTDEAVAIEAEVPGLKAEDLEVSLEGRTLTLKGSRSLEPKEGQRLVSREISQSSFARTFELPFAIDPKGVKATLSSGILTLEVQRSEEDKPRKIPVTTK